MKREHPVISACLNALDALGGPQKVTRMFRAANEAGELPDSAGNTIRGRLSQHVQHARRDGEEPAIVRLPKRRGWMRTGERLRGVRLTDTWMQDVKAPAPLRALVADMEGSATLADVLRERGLDEESIAWLLETIPFDPELRARLESATGTAERCQVLDEAG